MTKLSKVIMANALALISVLGLSFKVDARLTKVEQMGNAFPTDGS